LHHCAHAQSVAVKRPHCTARGPKAGIDGIDARQRYEVFFIAGARAYYRRQAPIPVQRARLATFLHPRDIEQERANPLSSAACG
jgi:hypothetical protein